MGRKKEPERPKTAYKHLREAELNRGRAALYVGPRGSALTRGTVRKWFMLITTVAIGGAMMWALAT